MTTFTLEQINPQALTWILDEICACDPIHDTSSVPPAILLSREGKIKDVIDGYHRLGGMISGGLTAATAIIYDADLASDDDENLVAAAADPNGYGGIEQNEAIECIYRAAGFPIA